MRSRVGSRRNDRSRGERGFVLGPLRRRLPGIASVGLEHPDDGGTTRAKFKELGERETTVRFESRFRHKDGSYRWLSWNVHPLSESQLVFAVARDVTERKRVEAEQEKLKKEGTFKAAEARYTAADQVDTGDLERWLKKARDIQWDYRNLARRKGRLERLK